ncbi:MAG: hypothetical protein E7401_06020 [Ruminococcaceae bacterium]|nr:hypothetical protein [Oscillospiraceae bacterium]
MSTLFLNFFNSFFGLDPVARRNSFILTHPSPFVKYFFTKNLYFFIYYYYFFELYPYDKKTINIDGFFLI